MAAVGGEKPAFYPRAGGAPRERASLTGKFDTLISISWRNR
jgi:hypothetical protein